MRTAKSAATFAALALGAAGLGACGGSEDDGVAAAGQRAARQQLRITVSGPWQIQAPASAEPGLTKIRVKNESGEPADAQLIPVEGRHSPAEVIEAHDAAAAGRAVPGWFGAGGGVAGVKPGSRESVIQVLQPGRYYVFNTFTEERPSPDSLPVIDVAGERSNDTLPRRAAAVEASEYAFEARGLDAGKNKILFENAGVEPHHLVALPIARRKTLDDVREFFQTEQGEPPVDFAREQRTAVLGGRQSQLVNLDLERGRYALLCFISDRAGGPPHVQMGMASEVEVTR